MNNIPGTRGSKQYDVLEILYAVFAVVVGLVAFSGMVLWFTVVREKDAMAPFALAQISATIGGLVLVGLLVQVALDRRRLLKQLVWIVRLLILGAVGAVAAAFSGEAAGETASGIPGIGEDLECHENLTTAAVWLSIVLALGRTHLTMKRRFAGAIRIVYLVFALCAAGLIAASGYTGGRLVYEYGAGTAPVREMLKGHAE